MRSVYEQQILDAFLKIYSYHHNAMWACETLDYMIFVEHAKEFMSLNKGDYIILTGGFPNTTTKQITNLMKIEQI